MRTRAWGDRRRPRSGEVPGAHGRPAPSLTAAARALIAGLTRAGVRRLVVVGGAGSLDWTYLSPAAVFQPGQRTGRYRTGGDQLLVDAEGRSTISFEDYAVALLDELKRPQHVGRRISVAY